MIILVNLIILLFCKQIDSLLEPSFQLIPIKYSFSDNPSIKILKLKTGKYFEYDFGKHNIEIDHLKVTSRDALPNWLTYDYNKKKLYGIPTIQDVIHGLRIETQRKHDNDTTEFNEENFVLIIDVSKSINGHYQCDYIRHGSPSIVSIVFNGDISNIQAAERVIILDNLANIFNKRRWHFYLELGNLIESVDIGSSHLRMAGPGDRIASNEKAFTISFVLTCSEDILGLHELALLRTLSQQQDFSSFSDIPVMGWFVETLKQHRVKRDAGNFKVQGTPSIQPSSKMVASSSDVISPTPSKTTHVSPITSSQSSVTTEKPTTVPVTTSERTTRGNSNRLSQCILVFLFTLFVSLVGNFL